MKRAIVLFCSLLALAACVPAATAAAATAARPVVAAPVGARVFTVYFGWNRSWVGPEPAWRSCSRPQPSTAPAAW